MFSNYKPDNARLLGKCFEFDWEQIAPNVELFIKESKERAATKEILKDNYKVVRDAYKYLGGLDCIGNLPSISGTAFSQFVMTHCKDFVDSKVLHIKDLDLSKAAVKGKDIKRVSRFVPADRLIRYNFLEIFIRIAK